MLFASVFSLAAQNIRSMEFNNQDITDILLALASASGKSIIADETVTGKASFYFSESDFDQSLNDFLSTYKLYSKTENNVIKVSRIFVSHDETKGTVNLKAEDVQIDSLLKALSKEIGRTILYDSLPSNTITVAMEDVSIEDAINICIRKLSDYQLESQNSYYYVQKLEKNSSRASRGNAKVLAHNGDLYSLNLEKGTLMELLPQLFNEQKVEYSLFLQNDVQLSNLYFENKDFDTLLSLVLEQANADYAVRNGIYYVLDLQKKGIGAKVRSTEICRLKWLQAQDLVSLLPSDLSSSSVIKVDKNTNSVLLTGTKEEIIPVKNFIEEIDIPSGGLVFKTVDVKYLAAADVISMLPSKLVQITPVQIPNTNTILLSGSEESLKAVEDFINQIDIKKAGIPVHLKYVQAADFLAALPPSISESDIVDSGYPNLLFYTGSQQNYNLLQEELRLIDRPKPQIKYQMLVIQYSKSKSFSFKPQLTITQNAADAVSAVFSGDLSNIMSLSFDVISTFGYQFAENLNAQIGTNVANVFTDTTLTALSGQEVNFQNTDTYRYIEYEYDSTSSTTTKTGTTQTITSGLIVGLNGWISGDNMITMSVDATVSKQNNSSSSSSSSSSLTTLPSTSERVVSTQVRTQSGEPVIISGLIKEDDSNTENKIPFLGYIPLIGKLFTQTTDSKEKTEIVIYIVPHLVTEDYGENTDTINVERYYSEILGSNS